MLTVMPLGGEERMVATPNEQVQQQASLFDASSRDYRLSQLLETPLNFCEHQIKFTQAEAQLIHFEAKWITGDEAHSPVTKCGLLSSQMKNVIIKPTLLDRPLVMALKTPLCVPPRSKLSVMCARPLAFEVIATDGEHPLTMWTTTTTRLRSTSYGHITEPMICYYWVSDVSETIPEGNQVLVPIEVCNQSKESVEFKKLTLYRDYLQLYRDHHVFVTNQLQVLISSPTEAYIEYGDTPSADYHDAKLIYESSQRQQGVLRRISRFIGKRGTGIEYGF